VPESIYLTHSESEGSVYEATSLDQAQAMASTGWKLASQSDVDKAAKATVDSQNAAYEARVASDERVVVTADSKPKGFTLDRPAPGDAPSPSLSEPSPPTEAKRAK